MQSNGMRLNVAREPLRVERRWKPKEGSAAAETVGDLCWKHKGLAEFLKFEVRIKISV